MVTPQAFVEFRKSLGTVTSPGAANFSKVVLGSDRTLKGPEGAFASMFENNDSQAFGGDFVPPAPTMDSKANAVELIELYSASLLRDVPFQDYGMNATAIAAAQELSAFTEYAGPRDAAGNVTPQLLFRGGLKAGRKTYFAGGSDEEKLMERRD